MNCENGKQEPLVKGGSLNEKKSRIVSYAVPGIPLSPEYHEVYSDERFWGLGIDPAFVTVVGHSLGGHLAMLADRFFSELNVQNIVTLNASGFFDGTAPGSVSDFIYGGAVIVCADNYAATNARRCRA